MGSFRALISAAADLVSEVTSSRRPVSTASSTRCPSHVVLPQPGGPIIRDSLLSISLSCIAVPVFSSGDSSPLVWFSPASGSLVPTGAPRCGGSLLPGVRFRHSFLCPWKNPFIYAHTEFRFSFSSFEAIPLWKRLC